MSEAIWDIWNLGNFASLAGWGKAPPCWWRSHCRCGKPCRPWRSVPKQMLPYCLKATEQNQLLEMFVCGAKKTGEKTNHQESRIKNQQQQQQKALYFVVWDILEMMDLDLGYCVPEWKPHEISSFRILIQSNKRKIWMPGANTSLTGGSAAALTVASRGRCKMKWSIQIMTWCSYSSWWISKRELVSIGNSLWLC